MRILNFLLVPALFGILSCSGVLEPTEDDFARPAGMILVAAKDSSFLYGDPERGQEVPSRIVTFRSDFFMDTVEVTRYLFDSIVSAVHPQYASPWEEGDVFGFPDSYAANFITFHGAILFCNARSKVEQRDTCYHYDTLEWVDGLPRVVGLIPDTKAEGYRLPTDAEWEYAARSGSSSRYLTGEEWLPTKAARVGNLGTRMFELGAQFLPNSYGLYDMFGNVEELTWGAAHLENPSSDPIVEPWDELPDGAYTVSRGGSFYDMKVRIGERAPRFSMSSRVTVGFRCVLKPN